jgi:hypothetical protein
MKRRRIGPMISRPTTLIFSPLKIQMVNSKLKMNMFGAIKPLDFLLKSNLTLRLKMRVRYVHAFQKIKYHSPPWEIVMPYHGL